MNEKYKIALELPYRFGDKQFKFDPQLNDEEKKFITNLIEIGQYIEDQKTLIAFINECLHVVHKTNPQIIRNAFVEGMKSQMFIDRDHPNLKFGEGSEYHEEHLQKFMEHAEDVTYGWFAPR